ncbi:MAG: prohibitin family protein [Anaerolineales bacterium]|jgi:regulator of protease activity HflC (stomatin/prohibitin superfamily)
MNFSSVLQGLVAFLWIAVVGMIILAVVRAARGYKVRTLSVAVLVTAILAVVLTTISAGLVFIQPEERGVVISAIAEDGYRREPLQPGLNWIIPYFESVVRYPISRQTYTMSIAPSEGQIQGDDSVAARTSDGQEIFLDASVIYAIDPAEVVKVHIDWQNRYTQELVRPISRGIIRDAVSQFRVEEVVSSKRFELQEFITERTKEMLAQNGLMMTDFVLRNIQFSQEYAASVEQKQIAEQQAQQARFVVEQRRQEADQAREVAKGQRDASITIAEGKAEARLIEADAEAKALLLVADALRDNSDLLTYTYITKIAPGVQVMLLPSDNQFLFPLPTLEPGSNLQSVLPTPMPTPVPTPEATP